MGFILLLFLTFYTIYTQPCAAPANLIGTTASNGVCTPPVPAASLITFPYASLGLTTASSTKFSVSFWFQPPSGPVTGGSSYGILRVSQDVTDTVPTTTDGIRLAVYYSLDSTNKGFYLGYSESPSDPILYTDITQMAITYSGGWMFIYAGLDYSTGEMKISTWEVKQIFWQQKTFMASKVNFNTPLTTSAQIDVFYWGSQNSFCGSIKKLNWMPKYYETIDENIFKLPYFLEGKTNTNIYIYRFDKIAQNKVTNQASSGQITLQQNMQFTYYVMNSAKPVVQLPTAKWTTSTNSYSFGAYILLTQMPQFAQDLYLIQRQATAGTVLFAIKLATQSNGLLGVILILQTTTKLLGQFTCLVDEWYLIQVSVAFAGSLSGQVNTLAHYHVMGPDGTILHGYTQITYTATISSVFGGGDNVYMGDTLNPITDELWIRYLRLDEGFQIFLNSPCLTDCSVGRHSLTSSEMYCLVCDLAAKLDSTYLCTQNQCSANHYEITDMTSHNFCAFCDSAQSYYVNPSQICIQAGCGNGYKEPPAEDCDDSNILSGDGCDSSCLYEVGYNCAPATDYQLTTCIIYCGNGVRDQVLTPAALAYTEVCDDGNTVSGDGCNNCAVESDLWECGLSFPSICTPLCGNGKLNNVVALSQTEACDDGNTVNGDGCSSSCTVEATWMCSAVSLQMSVCILICGNGSIDAGETCDDGNVIPGDGCTNCAIDPGWQCTGTICTQYCGDGTVQVAQSEQCDDGNSIQYDGCYNCLVESGWTCDANNPSQCHLCGNGKKEPHETCDDGNTNNGDGCSSTCQIESSWTCDGGTPDLCNNCGDAKKQQIEECDDGNAVSNDGCTGCVIDNYFSCSGGSPTTPDICVRTCPNGIVEGSEQCDDGNNINGDGCYQCKITMGFVCDNSVQPSVCSVDTCGNGKSHSTTEQCDDGNTLNDDGCSSTCQIEIGWACTDICQPVCGDGIRLPVEVCDDGNLIDGDGCSSKCKVELAYSCSGGSLTNKDTCKVTCGDNTRDSNEECDDGNTRNGDGCSSLCLIETGFGCSTVTMQDDSLRDECYSCISNCAVCTDKDILSCKLCYVGYYKSDTACTNSCDDGYYPDSVAQSCLVCGTNCVKCFSTAQCYRCKSPYLLSGTECVKKCPDGYYVSDHELKGQWCKKCPNHCTACTSNTLCTTCDNYYSPNGVCKYCDMGTLCLGCDFETNTCKKCILGYRPIEDGCIKIDAKCGDGLVALTEACDDGNLANGDGCSRTCTIETGANCRLVANEGPSECFDTLGWEFSLTSYILDPTLIMLTFSDSIMYDNVTITDIGTLFTLTINGFQSTDYTYEFKNNSGSNSSIYIQFTFLKDVVSQTLTVTLTDKLKLVNYYGVTINPDKVTQTIDLEDKEFYTDSQINFFTLLRNVAYGLQILNWILVIGAGFLDQQYRIWKTVEMLQVICAFYYVNLRSYPLNAEMLLVDLRYSNLYILPNYLQQHTNEFLLSSRRFAMAGLTYEVLNNTGGLFLQYLALSLIIYAFVKIVYNRYVLNVFEVFLDKLEFSYFFKFYEVFLLELLISCLHNVRFNSMASNWNGTNTVVALILVLVIFLVQATQFLVAFFRDRFGTPGEVQVMFGTLFDGCQDHDRKRRLFMSQQDFLRKVFLAYAMVYVSDPFQQILIIVVPRAVLSIISSLIFKNHYLRAKELLSELLLYGIMGMVYLLSTNNFVGDLQTKIFYGQLWVYLVLGMLLLHGGCNTYLVWRLLYVLESTLPEDVDPSAGLNKKVDLFKVRGPKFKGKTQQEINDEAERKRREEEARWKKRQEAEQALKNANREKWNVWDMKREARPEEQRFISINHNELGDELAPQPPKVPKLQIQQEELVNFDDLDQLDQIFGQPQPMGSISQLMRTNNKLTSLNQTQQMNQTQMNQTQQMNQTSQKINSQSVMGQTQKSGKLSQSQLNQPNMNQTQQINQTYQQPQNDSLMQIGNKSQIKPEQQPQQSTFQFPQQEPQQAKRADESQVEESIINDNPFDF